jgi:hypothetical protein
VHDAVNVPVPATVDADGWVGVLAVEDVAMEVAVEVVPDPQAATRKARPIADGSERRRVVLFIKVSSV